MIPLSALVDLRPVVRGFEVLPRFMAARFRDGVERVLLGQRKDFFARTPVHLGTKGRGIGRARFWPVKVTGDTLDAVRGSMGTGSPAAGILEKGGTIRPRSGRKYLAVTIGLGRTADGRRRRGYGSPEQARRKLGREFVAVNSRGRLFLRQKVARRGRRRKGQAAAQVLGGVAFVLKPRLVIRPQLRFYQLWTSNLDAAARRLGENIQRAIDDAFKLGVALV